MRNPGKTLGSRQKVIDEKLPHLKQVGKHDSRIVSTEQEIIEFSKLGGLAMFNIQKTYFSRVKPYIWSICFLDWTLNRNDYVTV